VYSTAQTSVFAEGQIVKIGSDLPNAALWVQVVVGTWFDLGELEFVELFDLFQTNDIPFDIVVNSHTCF
jgi:hypothetical protein